MIGKLRAVAVHSVMELVVVVGSGCAFGDRYVELKYELTNDYVRPRVDGRVAVVTFEDARPRERKHDVGEVRNGFGMVTADVRIDTKNDQGNIQNIGAWVADALAVELEAAGAEVGRYESPGQAAGYPVVVSGTVHQVWVNMYMTYDSKVRTHVQIARDGAVVFSGPVKGDDDDMAWGVSKSEYEKALVHALQDWIQHALTLVAEHMP